MKIFKALTLGVALALPLTAATVVTPAGAASHAKKKMDIVDTAVKAGKFGTLVTAVKAAGLVETLKGDGPFTVFAPTDAAFAALPEGVLDTLLKPENKAALTKVLTYHVVPGKVMSKDIAGKQMDAKTVQGGAIDVDAKSGVKVNGAKVVSADIGASNGVIHVIDAVLLPKELRGSF